MAFPDFTADEEKFIEAAIDAYRWSNSIFQARSQDDIKRGFNRAMARRVASKLTKLAKELTEYAEKCDP